ncbi:MAG: hypothetical protein DRP74_08360, partial [Candidatus Omnitrophota bacterium]
TLVFVWVKISQHLTFRTGAYDLSMYDSALSNTIKGNFMYTRWLGRNFFSEHFAPVLLLLLPFYILCDNPLTLVILMAVIVVLSAYPLYLIAKDKLSSKLASLAIAFIYLNYDFLIKGFLFDFHHEVFEPLFIFTAFIFLYKNKPLRYFIFVILGLSCKEDMPVYVAMFGIYACLVEKKCKLGILTIAISVAWAILTFKIIIPMSFPNQPGATKFIERWSQHGNSYTQIALTLLTHPQYLFGKKFILAALRLLIPLAFVPIASPFTLLLCIPPILLNTTSGYDQMYNLAGHYAFPIIPYVFIALVLGLKNIKNKFPKKFNMILICFCIYGLFENINNLNAYVITKHDFIGYSAVKAIPNNVSVSAQTSIIPHLNRSHQAYLLPQKLDTDYIIFDEKRFRWPMTDEEYNTLLQKFKNHNDYELKFSGDGFYLFKKIP